MNLTILYLTKEDSTKLKKRCEKGKSSDFPFLCLSVPERATCEHIKDDLTRNVRMDRLIVHEGIRTSDPTLRSEF